MKGCLWVRRLLRLHGMLMLFQLLVVLRSDRRINAEPEEKWQMVGLGALDVGLAPKK